MARGRINRILLPTIVRYILFALISTSLLVIILLMLRLVTTLTYEINRMSNESNHHQQLSTDQVLYYIKNFLMLVLFGSLQVFGLFGLSRNNKNVLIAFGSSLTIGFILAMFDHLFHSGYLHFAMYLLIESLFTFLYLLVLPIKQRPISNIHYIPMPSEDTFAQVVVTSPEYLVVREKQLRFILTFLQMQKIIFAFLWFGVQSKSKCKHDVSKVDRIDGIITASYIMIALCGIISLYLGHQTLVIIFIMIDLTYEILYYHFTLIDTIFLPIFIVLTIILYILYLSVIWYNKRHPIIEYGPTKSIPSPPWWSYSNNTSLSTH
ncbi:hypothetical protein RDWZM_008046 [Blomia tropicalis]|uniref:Uncharacterized protein n=1 Tax=Blomia tropicalis TaxID=40697 RepID=A0A9Q0M0Y8_BLOTA|nr:hypothetical protein RDWZM_008046 [Blomia tropicalis]